MACGCDEAARVDLGMTAISGILVTIRRAFTARSGRLPVLAVALLGVAMPACAQDVVKVSVGQRGNWDASVSDIGQRAGIFRKHGLALDIVYTSGAAETLHALIAGQADVAVAAGTVNVLAAYAKGAPLRVLGAGMTGVSDLYWYVKADSPIRSLKDAAGRTIAYSAEHSLTHRIVTVLLNQRGLKAKPVATGGPAGTLTQVMTDGINIGWAAPPFGLERIESQQIRIIAGGNDAPAFKAQTVRLIVTHAQVQETRKAVLDRYMKAYRETIDLMYTDTGLQIYAAGFGVRAETARRMRDVFFPKAALNPDAVRGLDASLRALAAINVPTESLTQERLAELLQIPRR